VTLPGKPTAEDIQQYRNIHECGVFEARDALNQTWCRECLRQIRANAGELYTIEQCKDVIINLVDLLIKLEHIDD